MKGGHCPHPINIWHNNNACDPVKELQAFHYICLYFNPKAVRLSQNYSLFIIHYSLNITVPACPLTASPA